MRTIVSLSPTADNMFTQVRTAVLAALPSGVEVVQSQVNRTPEPKSDDFVVMTILRLPRLGTNYDSFTDCVFTASIAPGTAPIAAVMSVTAVDPDFDGAIQTGGAVFGPSVTDGTVVVGQMTGPPGGVGTYALSMSQTVSSETMAAGTQALIQPTEVAMQLDVHGPSSWNNSQRLTTLFRDEVGVEMFASAGGPLVPLYCEDPRQMPFDNEQDQVEDRFVVVLVMDAYQKLVVSQEFAAEVDITLTDATTLPL